MGDKVKFSNFWKTNSSVVLPAISDVMGYSFSILGRNLDGNAFIILGISFIIMAILIAALGIIVNSIVYNEQKKPKFFKNNDEIYFTNGSTTTNTFTSDSENSNNKKQILIRTLIAAISIIILIISLPHLKGSSISHDTDSYETSSTFASMSEFDTSFALPSILNTGIGVKVAPISSAPLSVQAIDPINNSIGETEILQINDSIFENNSYNDYPFSPAVSGTYRFEFSNVPDGTDFTLYILNSAGERKEYASYCDNGSGITTSLSSKKNYTIRVAQQCETGSYTLNIGQQKKTSDISSYTAVSDSIQYTDQKK